jgi:hypothetical protein
MSVLQQNINFNPEFHIVTIYPNIIFSNIFMISRQNNCGLPNKTNEIVTSLYPTISKIICFKEHHLKYKQI